MQTHKFPLYPKVTSRSFFLWNEKMFKKYNNERIYEHSSFIIRFIERRRVQKILEYLRPFSQSQYILAAGCGEGYIENRIPKAKVLLVDISKEAISRAKEKLQKVKRYQFLRSDLGHIAVPQKTFDKIECSEVIEHVLSPVKMLNEFHRVLKDDGSLIVSFPNEPLINFIKKVLIYVGVFHHFFPNVPEDMTEEWHLRSYTLNAFKKDIGDKWSIQKVAGAPFRFFPIRYIVLSTKVQSRSFKNH